MRKPNLISVYLKNDTTYLKKKVYDRPDGTIIGANVVEFWLTDDDLAIIPLDVVSNIILHFGDPYAIR